MQTQKLILRRTVLLIGFVCIAALAGCSKDDSTSNPVTTPSPGGGSAVTLQNISFSPGSLTVSAGTTVTWTNKDNVTHTVTSGTPGAPDGMFDSGNLGNGGTFQYTFATKGTFQYYCRPHASSMKGTVIVQ